MLTLGTQDAPTEPVISVAGVTVTGGVNRTVPSPELVRGGGILIPSGAFGSDGPSLWATVTIINSVISGNRVQPSGSADWGLACPDGYECPGAFAGGGGIDSSGNLTLISSVVRDNHAVSDTAFAGGGGIRVPSAR